VKNGEIPQNGNQKKKATHPLQRKMLSVKHVGKIPDNTALTINIWKEKKKLSSSTSGNLLKEYKKIERK